jgi:hypothetical protein
VESLANIKVIFFLASKSDQRKLFAGLEKKLLWSKLETESWIGF